MRIPTVKHRSDSSLMAWSALAGCVLLAGGCDDVSLNLQQQPNRPVRPTPRPITAAPPQRTPATRPAGAANQQATQPIPTPVVLDPGATAEYEQVVLHNGPAPGDPPPGLRYIQLTRAAAGDVGLVLSWLYVPTGPTGTQARYGLVYPTRREADAAAVQAAVLDTPASSAGSEATLPTDPVASFRFGVGLLYDQPPGLPIDSRRARRAEAALTRTAADSGVVPTMRWAAAMISGAVATEYLGDPGAAERHFTAAEALAAAGSLEHLTARFGRVSALVQVGRRDQAREQLIRIEATFEPLRGTEVYERCLRLGSELNQRN